MWETKPGDSNNPAGCPFQISWDKDPDNPNSDVVYNKAGQSYGIAMKDSNISMTITTDVNKQPELFLTVPVIGNTGMTGNTGLCGNGNGDPSDDWLDESSGRVHKLYDV